MAKFNIGDTVSVITASGTIEGITITADGTRYTVAGVEGSVTADTLVAAPKPRKTRLNGSGPKRGKPRKEKPSEAATETVQ